MAMTLNEYSKRISLIKKIKRSRWRLALRVARYMMGFEPKLYFEKPDYMVWKRNINKIKYHCRF